jgi:hypothetical protein
MHVTSGPCTHCLFYLSLSNVVVTRVIAQIRSRQTDLRRHLLHRLKSHVTMPECLEVVTALRRLNSIDLERQSEVDLEAIHACAELRLQVDFLEARDAWLDSTATPAGNSSSSRPALLQLGSSEQLLDAIERHRTRYVYYMNTGILLSVVVAFILLLFISLFLLYSTQRV